ncbi:MAG: DeoR/GlpR transcriptional regulator [Firmicutes bacterium]|nr:DeoR/GlpR transcriptional regulator [Bacillota bacterium]
MLNERQQQILNIMENTGEIQLQQLKEMFPDVSTMTLRRDLINLENEGYLIRTYGGAVSVKKVGVTQKEEDAYSIRATENVEAKMKIAEKAVGMVETGRSIYFDAGSTLMCLARIIPDDSFSILTSGANIALELVKKLRPSVVTLGGQINRNTLSMSGPYANSLLDLVNIDLAFMSASGFSVDSGFTVGNIYECELKRKVVKRAKKVIMLMDTSKINKNLPFTYATLEDIDIWVCEKPLPEDLMEEIRRHDVEVL